MAAHVPRGGAAPDAVPPGPARGGETTPEGPRPAPPAVAPEVGSAEAQRAAQPADGGGNATKSRRFEWADVDIMDEPDLVLMSEIKPVSTGIGASLLRRLVLARGLCDYAYVTLYFQGWMLAGTLPRGTATRYMKVFHNAVHQAIVDGLRAFRALG